MIKRKPLLFLAVTIVMVALFAASDVAAQTTAICGNDYTLTAVRTAQYLPDGHYSDSSANIDFYCTDSSGNAIGCYAWVYDISGSSKALASLTNVGLCRDPQVLRLWGHSSLADYEWWEGLGGNEKLYQGQDCRAASLQAQAVNNAPTQRIVIASSSNKAGKMAMAALTSRAVNNCLSYDPNTQELTGGIIGPGTESVLPTQVCETITIPAPTDIVDDNGETIELEDCIMKVCYNPFTAEYIDGDCTFINALGQKTGQTTGTPFPVEDFCDGKVKALPDKSHAKFECSPGEDCTYYFGQLICSTPCCPDPYHCPPYPDCY